MKTSFTSVTFRSFVYTCILVSLSANLFAVSHNVTVKNYEFSPKELTINVGDVVIWTNTEGTHNVNGTKGTFPNNSESFGNEVAAAGWTYNYAFNTAGTYDYQCDPHAAFGMIGKIIVNPKVDSPPTLTINFTGMTPHIGEILWLAVVDKATMMEIARVKKAVDAADFNMIVSGIETGKSYNVDFWADHNKNGIYDAFPVDHSWRLTLDNATLNSVLNFAHNTNFTDIAWKNKLTVHFTGMTPHLGQKLTLYLKQADTNVYVDTLMVDPVGTAIFDIMSYKIMPGKSYKIDFYADHNNNGKYDAPPADHAWRIKLNNVLGDTIVNFVHNTSFTDIFGPQSHNITADPLTFTPAIQTISVGDTVIWTNTQGNHNVNGTKTTFPNNPESFGNEVGAGWTYEYVFITAGTYDYQCDPHAALGMVGQIIVTPKLETGPFTLTVNFTGMTPHVGETLWLAVIDKTSKMELSRVKKAVDAVEFSIEVPGIEMGKSYNVDFWADHNKNGIYDSFPADHSWRLTLDNVTGNSVLDFAHNTNFTDIAWKNRLTVHFTGMTPHLGEMLMLYLKQSDTSLYKDTVMLDPVATADFDLMSYEIKPGQSYHIDFYADHNKSGVYNSPPSDHAWRIDLNNVEGDTIVNFVHNTTFTDIFNVTSVPEIANRSGKLYIFPNPTSQYLNLKIPDSYESVRNIKVYSITGSLVNIKTISGNAEQVNFDVSQFKNGIYFMEIKAGNRKEVLKFIKR